MNVLLSDSLPDATDKQTRNSAGKTSLIEIIHFLLGADCGPDSIFRTDALIGHTFSGEFEFWGKDYSVERCGTQPSRIFIDDGLDGVPEQFIKIDKKTEKPFISNENWKLVLAELLFKIPATKAGTPFEQSFTPSFRSMFSYFARREDSGGFKTPEKQAEKQQTWDWQENVSYLFGLDWRLPFEFQKIRDREKTLKELKKAAKKGALGPVIGTVADLRSALTVAEKKVGQRQMELQNFQVLESYNDLSLQASAAKSDLQRLSRETIILRETLNHLEEALDGEKAQDSSAVEQVYLAAGIELPNMVLKKLEDVKLFYASVVQNRRTHLRNEVDKVSEKIQSNLDRMGELDSRRQEILKILESKGALEDFLSLQKEFAELEAEAANLKERYKAAELLEGEKTDLYIDRGKLLRRLQQDYRERREILDRAILIVTEAISELYQDRAGIFKIAATDNGPEFRISIEGDRGTGIASMEIFCFDLALLIVNAEKARGPGFLVHDSHLFDGVDERQISRALALGKTKSEELGLQYIVTMNSDIFDRLPLPDFIDRKKIVLETRLSDQDDEGGLFGIRFD